MRARSIPEIVSVAEARQLLDLAGPVASEALDAAFRRAIKVAADPDHYRRVIAAWRWLQAQDTQRPALPSPGLSVGITPLEALRGCSVDLRHLGDRLTGRIPAGTRARDGVTLRGSRDRVRARVVIRSEHGVSVLGDDLYMTTTVYPRVLSDGGRIEIATHAGPRSAWVTPGLESPRLRIKNLGLPPRGSRGQGHLFIMLLPSVDAPTPAEALLARFSQAWSQPLAA